MKYPYQLTVLIEYANNIPVADLMNSDPYVRISIRKRIIGRTPTILKNRNPVWNQKFDSIPVSNLYQNLILYLFDTDIGKDDDLIGVLNIPLLELSNLEPMVSKTYNVDCVGRFVASKPTLVITLYLQQNALILTSLRNEIPCTSKELADYRKQVDEILLSCQEIQVDADSLIATAQSKVFPLLEEIKKFVARRMTIAKECFEYCINRCFAEIISVLGALFNVLEESYLPRFTENHIHIYFQGFHFLYYIETQLYTFLSEDIITESPFKLLNFFNYDDFSNSFYSRLYNYVRDHIHKSFHENYVIRFQKDQKSGNLKTYSFTENIIVNMFFAEIFQLLHTLFQKEIRIEERILFENKKGSFILYHLEKNIIYMYYSLIKELSQCYQNHLLNLSSAVWPTLNAFDENESHLLKEQLLTSFINDAAYIINGNDWCFKAFFPRLNGNSIDSVSKAFLQLEEAFPLVSEIIKNFSLIEKMAVELLSTLILSNVFCRHQEFLKTDISGVLRIYITFSNQAFLGDEIFTTQLIKRLKSLQNWKENFSCERPFNLLAFNILRKFLILFYCVLFSFSVEWKKSNPNERIALIEIYHRVKSDAHQFLKCANEFMNLIRNEDAFDRYALDLFSCLFSFLSSNHLISAQSVNSLTEFADLPGSQGLFSDSKRDLHVLKSAIERFILLGTETNDSNENVESQISAVETSSNNKIGKDDFVSYFRENSQNLFEERTESYPSVSDSVKGGTGESVLDIVNSLGEIDQQFKTSKDPAKMIQFFFQSMRCFEEIVRVFRYDFPQWKSSDQSLQTILLREFSKYQRDLFLNTPISIMKCVYKSVPLNWKLSIQSLTLYDLLFLKPQPFPIVRCSVLMRRIDATNEVLSVKQTRIQPDMKDNDTIRREKSYFFHSRVHNEVLEFELGSLFSNSVDASSSGNFLTIPTPYQRYQFLIELLYHPTGNTNEESELVKIGDVIMDLFPFQNVRYENEFREFKCHHSNHHHAVVEAIRFAEKELRPLPSISFSFSSTLSCAR